MKNRNNKKENEENNLITGINGNKKPYSAPQVQIDIISMDSEIAITSILSKRANPN